MPTRIPLTLLASFSTAVVIQGQGWNEMGLVIQVARPEITLDYSSLYSPRCLTMKLLRHNEDPWRKDSCPGPEPGPAPVLSAILFYETFPRHKSSRSQLGSDCWTGVKICLARIQRASQSMMGKTSAFQVKKHYLNHT